MVLDSCKNRIKRIMKHAVFLFEVFFRKEWKEVLDEVARFWFFETFIEISAVQNLREEVVKHAIHVIKVACF